MENVSISVNSTGFSLLTDHWYHITASRKRIRIYDLNLDITLPSKKGNHCDRWSSGEHKPKTIVNYNNN